MFAVVVIVIVVELFLMSTNLDDVTILNMNGADYCCLNSGISKSKALNLLHKCWFQWNIMENYKL